MSHFGRLLSYVDGALTSSIAFDQAPIQDCISLSEKETTNLKVWALREMLTKEGKTSNMKMLRWRRMAPKEIATIRMRLQKRL